MALPGLSGEDLMEWVEQTSLGWRDLVTSNPGLLALPCDIRETHSVGELLQHIVAVELRYAERLSELAPTPYEAVPFDSSEALYKVHDRAASLLRQLKDRDGVFWEEVIDLSTRSGGKMRASRQAVFVHLHMHSVRHYAQLATLVRQNGTQPDWAMDYLFMKVEH